MNPQDLFDMIKSGKTEPSSDMRQLASVLRQLYVSVEDEGFSNSEAMAIVITFLAASVGK